MSRSADDAAPSATPDPPGSVPASAASPSSAAPAPASTPESAPKAGWRALLTRKRALVATAVAVVAVLLIAGTGLVGGGGKDIPPVLVKRDDLVVSVEVTGELAAVHAAELGAPPVRDMWDFKISFLAPESAQVKKS